MQDKENRYLKLITECEAVTIDIKQKTKFVQYNSPLAEKNVECYQSCDSELEQRLVDLKNSLVELNGKIVE